MMSAVLLAALLMPPAMLASSLVLPAWRAWLARASRPSMNAFTPALVLALPLLAVTVVLALTLVPLQHDDGTHVPHAVLDPQALGAWRWPLGAFAAFAGMVALARGADVLRRGFRHRRSVARALRDARLVRSGNRAVHLADLGAPNAFSAGWLRGSIVVDAAWWRSLRPAERRIVVEHEAAHVRRRDGLVVALLALASLVHPRALLSPLVRSWRAWAEVAADRAAAERHGDPADVASLLLREHRRLGRATGLAAPAFGDDGCLEIRIRALLDGTTPLSALRPDLGMPALATLAGIASLPLLGAGHVHGFAELLLGISHG